MESEFKKNRFALTAIIYATFLLDNILLTVIVPILPDYLASFKDVTLNQNIPSSVLYKNFDLHYIPNTMLNKHPVAGNTFKNSSKEVQQQQSQEFTVDMENEKVGLLLAIKAFVQLFFNPIVGSVLATRFGYKATIFFGTMSLLMASLFFAMGDSFMILLIARAIEGVGSSCVNVCGMSLIAHLYPEDHQRSKIMGFILGSIALGVLFGYPLGGFLYDFVSESAPFIIICAFLFTDLAFQMTFFDLTRNENEINGEENQAMRHGSSQWIQLLSHKLVFFSALAIWMSTSAMAILEPLLPIWLISQLHPKKWQLGTVFIPDSLGYFLGTNFFGAVAFRVGQVKMSVLAIMIVGMSCVVIPEAKTVSSLIIPHFCLGLGIGVLDASLVPYLAQLTDSIAQDGAGESMEEDSASNYGSVYAIQQTAVSLAYSVVPFMAGEMVQTVGFPAIMRTLGLCNFLYGPILLVITIRHNLNNAANKQPDLLLKETNPSNYRRFYNSIE